MRQTDIEIAQLAKMRKRSDVARNHLGIPQDDLEPFGHFKAKVSLSYLGVNIVLATHWGKGGKGAADLARMVVDLCEADHQQMQYVYEDQDTLWEKINKIAKKVYRAGEVTADSKVLAQIEDLQRQGYGHYPVCVAKTQSSFSTNPKSQGAPDNHVISVREVRLAASAEFVVMVCGDIMTMPGLPKKPFRREYRLYRW